MDADSAWDALAKAKANLKKVDKVVNKAVDDASRYSLIGEQDIEAINKQFNEELQQQIEGTLPNGHVYELGMPSDILLSTGIANVPIQLNSTKLLEKSSNFGHDYELHEI